MQGTKARNTGKKRIMLVVPMLDQGGLERVCALTGQLLKDKFDIYIAVFNTKGMIYDVSGTTLLDLKLGAVPSKFGKLCNVVKRSIKLTQLVKKYQIDVVYSFGRTANIASANIKASVKKMGACHSNEEIQNQRYLKLLDKKMDLIICCSKAMAYTVKKKVNPIKVRAIWNPCDIAQIQTLAEKPLEEYQSFFESPGKKIIAMGREDDVKGYWHLIKAFRRICEKLPYVKLVIMGTGDFTEYKMLAKKLCLEGQVLFTGLRLNPFQYLKRSDVMVLSSLSEGLPNALVEAMAVGLPIVSVNCQSGPAEILSEDWLSVDTEQKMNMKEFGILTPAFTQEKNMNFQILDEKIVLEPQEEVLAEGIYRVLTEKTLSINYHKAGLERCHDFSKESYCHQVTDAIMQLVGGK